MVEFEVFYSIGWGQMGRMLLVEAMAVEVKWLAEVHG